MLILTDLIIPWLADNITAYNVEFWFVYYKTQRAVRLKWSSYLNGTQLHRDSLRTIFFCSLCHCSLMSFLSLSSSFLRARRGWEEKQRRRLKWGFILKSWWELLSILWTRCFQGNKEMTPTLIKLSRETCGATKVNTFLVKIKTPKMRYIISIWNKFK